MANPVTLKFFQLHKDAQIPKFATEGSACFDLAYQPAADLESIDGFDNNNAPIKRRVGSRESVQGSPEVARRSIDIMPGERLIFPTGLILDIPSGYSVRVHPRSSVGIKLGLTLPNCEGVIDSDYVDELFVVLHNITNRKVTITPFTRLAQAELVS